MPLLTTEFIFLWFVLKIQRYIQNLPVASKNLMFAHKSKIMNHKNKLDKGCGELCIL